MNEFLLMLVTHLRLMNLCYHNFHNLTHGPVFFGDHVALEGFYKDLNDDYDAAVERAIGLGFSNVANLKQQLHIIEAHIGALPDVVDWSTVQALEIHLCDICKRIATDPMATSGLKNLVEGFADDSEVRQYKIKQRIK